MYQVTTRYELRKNKDLTGKLGYLEVGDVVDGWVELDGILRVSEVNFEVTWGYFPMKYLTPYTEPEPIPDPERYVIYHHDGINEKFVPE